MIAVDTNVLIRFLVRDDAKQSEATFRRLRKAEQEREVLLIPLLVVLETIWVLESAYDRDRLDILEALRDLREMPIFEFEAERVIGRFLQEAAHPRANLEDILIACAAEAAGASGGITFDRNAAKLPFFSLLR